MHKYSISEKYTINVGTNMYKVCGSQVRNVFRNIILNEINFKTGCALDKVPPDFRKCVRAPACFVDNQQSVSTVRQSGFKCTLVSCK